MALSGASTCSKVYALSLNVEPTISKSRLAWNQITNAPCGQFQALRSLGREWKGPRGACTGLQASEMKWTRDPTPHLPKGRTGIYRGWSPPPYQEGQRLTPGDHQRPSSAWSQRRACAFFIRSSVSRVLSHLREHRSSWGSPWTRETTGQLLLLLSCHCTSCHRGSDSTQDGQKGKVVFFLPYTEEVLSRERGWRGASAPRWCWRRLGRGPGRKARECLQASGSFGLSGGKCPRQLLIESLVILKHLTLQERGGREGR